MSQSARRPTDTPADDPTPPAGSPRMPVVIWCPDGPLCVTVLDAPAFEAHAGICRCGACSSANLPDSAAEFFGEE